MISKTIGFRGTNHFQTNPNILSTIQHSGSPQDIAKPSSPSRDARIVAVIVVVSNHRIHGVRLVHRHETILALHAEPATSRRATAWALGEPGTLAAAIDMASKHYSMVPWWTPKQQLLSSFHGCSFKQSYGIIGFDPFPCHDYII